MADDDSELDYIRTFLGKVHTAMTFKHIQEVGTNVDAAVFADNERGLVFPGEVTYISKDRWYIKRYKVVLSEDTEANLTTALNNIINGIDNLNIRATISGYTRPTTLIYGEFKYSNKSYYNGQTKRWYQDIFIDFSWSTA